MSEVFTVITYNLWKTNGVPTAWNVRAPIVERQLKKLRPDILMVQELHPKISATIVKALPNHKKAATNVKDEPGWDNEVGLKRSLQRSTECLVYNESLRFRETYSSIRQGSNAMGTWHAISVRKRRIVACSYAYLNA